MDRRHLILPAALLAGSALLAGRAALGALPLGVDTKPAASVGQLVDATSDDAIAARTEQLDAAERRLDALDAQVPPALPRVASQSAVIPARAAVSTSARSEDEHGGRGRDHDEDDDDASDDHDSDDDHGGDRDHDDDDHGGHDGGGDDD
jgi:hypothetical protein